MSPNVTRQRSGPRYLAPRFGRRYHECRLPSGTSLVSKTKQKGEGMDIFCPVCGEPWDLDELHGVPGVPFEAARRRFAGEGCGIFSTPHNSLIDSDRAAKSAVLHQLLGDDIDGIAALMEDLG